MADYRIVLTPQSYRDLDDVFAMVLRLSADKDTAYNYVEAIKSSIKSLKTFPNRGTIRTTGKHKGYRQIFIKEYAVVYRVDDIKKTVFVVAIKSKTDKT